MKKAGEPETKPETSRYELRSKTPKESEKTDPKRTEPTLADTLEVFEQTQPEFENKLEEPSVSDDSESTRSNKFETPTNSDSGPDRKQNVLSRLKHSDTRI